jgi:hypothetical protein
MWMTNNLKKFWIRGFDSRQDLAFIFLRKSKENLKWCTVTNPKEVVVLGPFRLLQNTKIQKLGLSNFRFHKHK